MRHLIRTISLPLILLSAIAAPVFAAGPADQFFDQMSALCGSRYIGEMTYPTEGQDSFKGKELVAEFKDCSDNELRVPFSVGDDTSRTWIFTKTEDGVRLKHDHRHKDGSPDEVTNYGGDSDKTGTAQHQSFPADLFTQELIPAAATNVWNISMSEDMSQLTYHLTRHGKPRFTAVLNRTQN